MSARDRIRWANEMVAKLGPDTALPLITATLAHDEWVKENRETEGMRYRHVSNEDIPVTPEEDDFLDSLTARLFEGASTLPPWAKRETQAERLERQAITALETGLHPEEVATTPPTADPHYSISAQVRRDKRPCAVSASPEESADNNLSLPLTDEKWHARLTEGEKTARLSQLRSPVGGGDSIPPQHRQEYQAGLKKREGDQELPQPNNSTPIQHLVLKDVLDRMDVGFKRYGTYLQPNNQRNGLRDLYEELLDGIVYLKQIMVEIEEGNFDGLRL